jgi:hypothetical protein
MKLTWWMLVLRTLNLANGYGDSLCLGTCRGSDALNKSPVTPSTIITPPSYIFEHHFQMSTRIIPSCKGVKWSDLLGSFQIMITHHGDSLISYTTRGDCLDEGTTYSDDHSDGKQNRGGTPTTNLCLPLASMTLH